MLDVIPHLFVKVHAVETLQMAAVAGVSTALQLSFPTGLNALGHEYQISSTSGVAGFSGWLPLALDKTISGLAATTSYWVKVRAVNGSQRSAASPVATATTNAAATTAIVQVGTTVQYDAPGPLDNTGTITGITVPVDAELIIYAIIGYYSANNGLSGGTVTFTKGGIDTAMTPAVTGAAAADFGGGHHAVFWMALPDTGSGKTLKWDWAGTTTMDQAQIHSWTFWKGIDTGSPAAAWQNTHAYVVGDKAKDTLENTYWICVFAHTSSNSPTTFAVDRATATGRWTQTTPIRHALAANNNPGGTYPVTVGPLTCVTGDKIVAVASIFSAGSEGSVTAWTNLTTLTQLTRWGDVGNSDGAWATSNPTGNTTVSVDAASVGTYPSMTAIVLKPGIA